MMTTLSGKKSYIVACAMVVYAVLGWWLKDKNLDSAIQLVLQGAGLAALRAAVAK